MIPTLVKSPVPTLIATLVGGTSLTLVHHIGEGLDNIQKSFWFSRIVFVYLHNVKINSGGINMMWKFGGKNEQN